MPNKTKRGVSTHMFIRQRLGSAILDRVAHAGFRLVEIFCARQHMDYRSRNQILDLAAWFASNEMKLHSMHMPMYSDDVWGKSGPQSRVSIAETEKLRRVEACDEIKRALEIAEAIPFDYAILHVGSTGEDYDERKMDAALWSIEHLRLFARQRGVSILLENTPNELSEPARLKALIHELRFPDLGVCFDSGHANMAGDPVEIWNAMQPLVRSTHLHDNDGDKDEHLFPREGTIDWDALGGAMHKSGGDFPWMLEIHDPSGVEDPVTHAWDLFERWEEKLNS
jgi:sugar phosphate isomerase/epimerase